MRATWSSKARHLLGCQRGSRVGVAQITPSCFGKRPTRHQIASRDAAAIGSHAPLPLRIASALAHKEFVEFEAFDIPSLLITQPSRSRSAGTSPEPYYTKSSFRSKEDVPRIFYEQLLPVQPRQSLPATISLAPLTDLEFSFFTAMSTKTKKPAGKASRSAIQDVVAREYTIHMHKRVRAHWGASKRKMPLRGMRAERGGDDAGNGI